ncbi:MAG: hypothetical protein ACLQRH_20425 [Acidimicrobiales bacterium]
MADSNLTDTTLGTDAFGESVAIAGNTIVVGDEDHNNRGYAYESDRAGLGWQLSGEQSGSNGFGITLAGSGPNLAVGTYSGRAYVYAQGEHGWHITAALKSPAGDDESYFGYSVALSGATLVATADSKPSNSGQLFVFTDGPTGWAKTAELGDPDIRRYSIFGSSAAISGNTMVVGDLYGASGQGRAYVYFDGSTGWDQAAELVDPDDGRKDTFGAPVAISGNTIVVGDPTYAKARGQVYVFTKTATGWHQTAELQGLNTAVGDQFGSAVGISGSNILVGADYSEGLRGTAYVFAKSAGSWKQVAELNPSGTIPNSDFGTAVAISGTTIVIGTDGDTGCSEMSINGGPSQPVDCAPPGSYGAYVYAETVSGWHEVTDLHRPSK